MNRSIPPATRTARKQNDYTISMPITRTISFRLLPCQLHNILQHTERAHNLSHRRSLKVRANCANSSPDRFAFNASTSTLMSAPSDSNISATPYWQSRTFATHFPYLFPGCWVGLDRDLCCRALVSGLPALLAGGDGFCGCLSALPFLGVACGQQSG